MLVMNDWPVQGLERVPSCPVCGETGRHPLHERLEDLIFRAPGLWTLYACEDCGSAYLDPRPTLETLLLAYQNYFTHEGPVAPDKIETLTWFRRVKRTLANGHRNWRFGSRFHPTSQLGVVAAWILPGMRVELKRSLWFLPRVFSGAIMLDVGCGNGDFLDRARAIGWRVRGIEPDPRARAQALALDLDVRDGEIEDLMAESVRFDVITLNHVIEHVPDPRRTLECALILLKPGGRLFLETPNVDSYGHRHFGRSWRGLEPPRHLVLMNWPAILGLLSEIGFVRIKHHASSDVYPALSAISRAIETQQDLRKIKPRLRDYWTSRRIGVKLLWNDRGSEFLTLVAHKPVAGN